MRVRLISISDPNLKNKNNKNVKDYILKNSLKEYKCSRKNCGLTNVWLNRTLVLQLEHKDGDRNNNKLSNLEFLCPNCHSQTETYAGKNSYKSRHTYTIRQL